MQTQQAYVSPSQYTIQSYVKDNFGPSYRCYMFDGKVDPNTISEKSMILMPIDKLCINRKAQRKEVSKKKIMAMIERGMKQSDSQDGYSATLFEPIKICYNKGNWFIMDGQQRKKLISVVNFPTMATSRGNRKFILCRYEGILDDAQQAKRFVDLNECRNKITAAEVRRVNTVIDPDSSQALIDEIAPQYNFILNAGPRSKSPNAISGAYFLNGVINDIKTFKPLAADYRAMTHSLFENLQMLYSKVQKRVEGDIIKGLGDFMIHAAKRKSSGATMFAKYSEDLLYVCIREMIAHDFDNFENLAKKINGKHSENGIRKMIEMYYNEYFPQSNRQIKLYDDYGNLI